MLSYINATQCYHSTGGVKRYPLKWLDSISFQAGSLNPTDLLGKHWGYAQIWPQLKTLLFWKEDTNNIEQQSNIATKWGVLNYL